MIEDLAEKGSVQARLGLAIEAARIGIWQWDILKNTFDYDSRGREIYGFEPDVPITYEALRARTHPDDLARAGGALRQAVDPAIRSHEPYEYRIVVPNGGVRWVYALGLVEFGQIDGIERAVRYTGTIQDITEKKLAEQALLASETRLRIAIEAARMGVWDYDGTTNTFKGSPELNRLYGFPPDQKIDLAAFATRYPPGEAERIAAAGAEALRRGDKYFQIEFRIVLPGGQERWMLLRAETEVTPDGRPARSLGVIMDITDRHAMETRLREALADREVAERDAERRFRILVNGLADSAIYLLDQDGRITSWNAGAERIKGYRSFEVIGKHFSMFYTDEDREKQAPTAALEEALNSGKSETDGWRVRKDGTRFWASAIVEPVYDNGVLIGFAKITRDVTEKREAQIRLDRTQEQLAQSQKMEAVGQLTGGVAHDFNNLLTVIQGNLEIAQRRLGHPPVDESTLRRVVSNAMEGARRAATLTQRLLAFARRQPLDPKRLDPNRIIKEAGDFLQTAVGDSIRVLTVGVGGVWQINADRQQLDTALLNLALNARDAMPNGGSITVETSNVYLDHDYCRANPEVNPGDYVLISVTDTGVGMSKENLVRAVEPFFTTKPVGQGTGLGLSQVYGFIKQSGGHFKLYSELGHGTTARIYLPRATGTGELSSPEAGELPRSTASAGETIFIAEDDDEVRRYLVEVLSDLGYRTIDAGNAESALARVAANDEKIDLLLTDVVLPDFNGRVLADRVRAIRPDLPVIFMTGYSRNAIVHQGRLDPGVTLIQKPLSQARLAQVIRDVFDAREDGPT